jgi:outer membrane lipoprotein-sorting protein
MNNNDHPSDELLQFVFGELNESRETAMRKEVADDSELAATVQGLESAVAAVHAENVGQVSAEFNERLRGRMSEILGSSQAETTSPTLLTRPLTTWRWIMRHPVFRLTAAAIFVLAVTGVALWFHIGGTTYAFADFVKPILEAKTVKYKLTTERTSLPTGMTEMMGLSEDTLKDLMKATTAEVMELDSNRSRTEWEMPGKLRMVEIWDGGQGKGLVLYPAEKRATSSNITNMPKDKNPNGGDPVAFYRSLLLDARDKSDVKRESLGEKDIDGCRVVGFRISLPAMVMSLWGNPKTGLPVRVETTVAIMPNIKLTMSDFEFNVDMDESLFSLELPAGYKVAEVQDHTIDDSPSDEKDLIEMFRYFGKWSGGRLPDLLDMEWLNMTVRMVEWCTANLEQPSEAKRKRDLAEAQKKLERA